MTLSPAWAARIGLIGAMVLWGSSFIALKIAFRAYDPMVVIFGRLILASFCFLLFWHHLTGGVQYRRGDWRWLLLMAFCEPCLYFIFEAKAIENTSASQAGMITALLPLMVAVAARFFLRERLHARMMVGFAAAVAGAVWLSWKAVPTANAPRPVLGNFFEFLAMVCAVGYTIILKYLSLRYSPSLLTAVQAFVGSVFYLPFLLLPSTVLPGHIDLSAAAAVAYLGVCVTIGAYRLYTFGISRISASQASAFVNLIPVFTAVLGHVILGEVMTAGQYGGCALIFAGIYLSQR
jgi:drug/metabolite transporter (DMT)-like permease